MRRFLISAAALCLVAGCSGGAHHSTTGHSAPSSHPTSARASAHTPVTQLVVTELPWRLPYAVSRQVAVVLGSRVTLLGGLLPGDITTARVVTLSQANGSVISRGALAQQTHDAAGVLLSGRTFVFGGGAANQLAAVQLYANGAGHVVGQLPTPRSDVVAVAVGDTAYVIGGYDGRAPLRDVLATTDGHTFHRAATLIEGVRYPAVAVDSGAIYVIGGETATGDTSLIQRVDLRTFAVTTAGHLPSTLAHAMAGVVGGNIVIAGGRRNGSRTSQLLSLDLATGRVTVVGALPRPLTDAGTAEINGALWLFGGESPQPVVAVIRVAMT